MEKNFNKRKIFDMANDMGAKATDEDIVNVANKMDSMNRGPLKKIWNKVEKLWEAFRSPDTPTSYKAMIIGSLIYMVSPLDIIPDVIPVVGLVDDAGVIAFAFSRLMNLTAIGILAAGITLTMRYIDKKNIEENIKALFQEDKFKSKIKKSPVTKLDDLEMEAEEEDKHTVTAKVTKVTSKLVTLDILASWGETLASDIKIEGEEIDDEIHEGTEITFLI